MNVLFKQEIDIHNTYTNVNISTSPESTLNRNTFRLVRLIALQFIRYRFRLFSLDLTFTGRLLYKVFILRHLSLHGIVDDEKINNFVNLNTKIKWMHGQWNTNPIYTYVTFINSAPMLYSDMCPTRQIYATIIIPRYIDSTASILLVSIQKQRCLLTMYITQSFWISHTYVSTIVHLTKLLYFLFKIYINTILYLPTN